jgi:predicted nucleotidyltransferase
MSIKQQAALPKDRRDAFEVLHRNHMLGEHETVSGQGSTLMVTHRLRKALAEMIGHGLFSSIFDIGCGDFHWLSVMDLTGVRYTGVDIVEELIAQNCERWQSPNRTFEVMDIVEKVPPQHDLIICKDVFNHMPFSDIVRAFNNIKQSGATYVCLNNYYPELAKPSQAEYNKKHLNTDIGSGYWRPLALCQPPFSFRPPLWSIIGNQSGKTFDIWALEDMPLLDEKVILHPPTHRLSERGDFDRYRFFKELCALPFIDNIYAYGSRAHGKHAPDSDLDLLIECSPEPSREQWLKVCDIIDHADLPFEIDCKLYTSTLLSVFDAYNPMRSLEELQPHLRLIYQRIVPYVA